jgi:hypothetical protein
LWFDEYGTTLKNEICEKSKREILSQQKKRFGKTLIQRSTRILKATLMGLPIMKLLSQKQKKTKK